jgi:hypothetical protein
MQVYEIGLEVLKDTAKIADRFGRVRGRATASSFPKRPKLGD